MYAQLIREAAASAGYLGANVRHLEAWMRSEQSTLDALTPAQFRDEVATAIDTMHAAPVAMSESLARSFGL